MRNLCHGIRVPDVCLKGLRKTRKTIRIFVLVKMKLGTSFTWQSCWVQCVTEDIFLSLLCSIRKFTIQRSKIWKKSSFAQYWFCMEQGIFQHFVEQVNTHFMCTVICNCCAIHCIMKEITLKCMDCVVDCKSGCIMDKFWIRHSLVVPGLVCPYYWYAL
jgi:hypothetical protein